MAHPNSGRSSIHQPSNVSTPYRQNPFDTPPALSTAPTQEKQDGYFPNVKTRKSAKNQALETDKLTDLQKLMCHEEGSSSALA